MAGGEGGDCVKEEIQFSMDCSFSIQAESRQERLGRFAEHCTRLPDA
jgi:predicted small metal-binding protein